MTSGSQFRWQSDRPCYFKNSVRASGCSENRGPSPGVGDLISTRKWLQTNGLKRQKLDLYSLLPKIGFKLSDDYDISLKKPVSSRYGNGLFPQVFRADGHTFNIVCCKEKLVQIANRLEDAVTRLKERLHWLTSGSRRIFGVIEEKCICVVVASRADDEKNFALLKKALQMLIEEQVPKLHAFNIILASLDNDAFHTQCAPISHDTMHNISQWIQRWPLPVCHTSTCVCEAVLKAVDDKDLEAVYLLCDGTAVNPCQELLRNKVLENGKRIPVHINTFNCNDKTLLAFLKRFAEEAGGRFHVYETYTGSDEKLSTEHNGIVSYPLAKSLFNEQKTEKATSVASREDVVQLFAELEEARNTLRHIQQLIDAAPERKSGIETTDSSELFAAEEHEDLNEDSICSREWLRRYGIEVHGLEIFDFLEGVAFKHREGVIDLLLPPRCPDIQTSAVSKKTFVNAKYCENFPAIQWKSGETVHVHVTPQVQRNYEKKMLMVLNAVQQRLNWLRKGSRALFGNVLEDDIYLAIDMSSSMESKLPDVLERIESLFQEQLQHKRKLNIVTFNRTTSAWKERLTEVTPKNIIEALTWLKRQSFGGSTNTYAALRIALADPNTQAIYLLTDGRPDQPPQAILAQVQMRPSVPIHTIAFNCNDEEANNFLYQLASLTGGRYHYYMDSDYNIQPPESWKCEDIRLLEEELDRGYRSLAIVSSLRKECLMSLWKGEIRKMKSCKCNDVSTDGSVISTKNKLIQSENSWSTTRPHSSSTPRLQQTEHYPLQWPFVPPCCKRNLHKHRVKMCNRHIHAASTKTSRLRHKIEFKQPMLSHKESHCHTAEEDKEEEKGEQEESDVYQEGNVQLQTLSDLDMEVEKVMLPEKQNFNGKHRTNARSSSVKSWLKRNKLSAKRLTIMDALSPTLIQHTTKNVPSINKRVLSKVFDEVFPLAHVMRDKNMQMTLVNPIGIDLAAYEKKLQKTIKLYMRYLDKLIWKGLPECSKEKFERKEPLPYFKNKSRLLAALRENDSPVAVEDIALLEREIEKGFKYLQISHDLQKSQLGLDENDLGTAAD